MNEQAACGTQQAERVVRRLPARLGGHGIGSMLSERCGWNRESMAARGRLAGMGSVTTDVGTDWWEIGR